MLSRCNALSKATLFLPTLYFAGMASAQQPAPALEQQPTQTEVTQPAAEPAAAEPAAEPGAPRRPKKAGEEELLVTGSRVHRKDLTTPAPITVISKEQVQASGKVSIGDFLQTLPEQGNAVNTSVNNGNVGSGSTRVNLRSLGAPRTLVLMNGRRVVPGGAGADSSTDLSSLPSAAIERIEVLKDGASAVYGSDAIAGVVNLITRKRMNGVEVSGYAGTSTHGDGTVYDLNGTAGTTGERGSLLFSGGYYNQQTVWAYSRAFANIPLAYDATGRTALSHQVGEYSQGSQTVPAGSFLLSPCGPNTPADAPCVGRQVSNPNNDPRIGYYNRLIARYPTATQFIHTTADDTRAVCDSSGNCWRAFTNAQLPEQGGDGWNFQPQNYLVTPQQRISLFSIGETKLGGGARGYFEGSYVNRQGGQTLAPEPVNLDLEGPITVSKDNAFNPFGVDLGSFHRRMLEFGTRDSIQDIDTYRIVVGLDGTLPEEMGVVKGWYWDVNFNYGRTISSNIKRGNLQDPALAQALGPSMSINGVPTCVSKAGDPSTAIPGCVPLNVFGGPSSIPSDQITPNIAYTGNLHGFNQLVSAQLNASGELFRLASDRPVGLALGYEYRIVAGENVPDPITVSGQTTGNKSTITAGHYYVNEGYGELSIPIVSGKTFAENLEATAAIRVFDYSNFGADYTYKFGGRWTIVRDFTFRGTYSTGFRAPSISDLYLGGADAFPTASDPCRGPAITGAPIPQNCLNQGIPSTGTGDISTQLRARSGGNPALQPEKSKMYTAGIVFEPRWVRGLTATLDYYHINIDQSIATIGAQLILNSCYPANADAAPRFCNLVQRSPDTQKVTYIINTTQNVGNDAIGGIDLALNYLLPTQVGRFNFIFDGTWLQKFDRTLADGSVIHGKNTYDIGVLTGGGVNAAFRFITGLRWGYEGFGAGVSTRFTSSFHECGTQTGNFNGTSTCYDNTGTARTVSAYNAWDLYASYAFPWNAGRTTVNVGVNNVFNTDPPKIYNGFLAASDPTAYDFMGRFFYGRITHAF
jgi:outer membrane receptor protein involved in Fe transport